MARKTITCNGLPVFHESLQRRLGLYLDADQLHLPLQPPLHPYLQVAHVLAVCSLVSTVLLSFKGVLNNQIKTKPTIDGIEDT